MSKKVHEITKKSQCTGCRVCEQICPVKCIDFKEDQEGFLFPTINAVECIGCGLCEKRCPSNAVQIGADNFKQIAFAAKSKDKEELKLSTSGGIFGLIAGFVIRQKGKVFGCAWDSDMRAIHTSADTIEGIQKMHGSKYVQSDIDKTFSEAKECLISGMWVLFTGTPCQIAGLYSYIGKKYERLITVDLICHGVPSPKFFKEYSDWISKKYRGKILNYEFRSKEKSSWGLTYKAKIKIKIKNKIKIKHLLATLDPYYSNFLSGQGYRECCYECKYACTNRKGDFTMGDFWGVDKFHKELIPKMSEGITALIVNTDKGKKFLDCMEDDKVELIMSDMKSVCAGNENLNHPVIRPKNRASFYEEVYKYGFNTYANNFYTSKNYFFALFKSWIPNNLKKIIKRLMKK